MSSIRPLITITVLVVVGVVLYVKINEGTPQPTRSASEAWNEPADGVPPLAASSVAPTTSDGAAPAWPATSVSPASDTPPENATPDARATTNSDIPPITATVEPSPAPAIPADAQPPAVPTIPAIPEVATTTTADAPATTGEPQPTSPPVIESGGRYAEQAPATEPAIPETAATVPAPVTEAPPVTTEPTAAAASSSQEAATTPEQMNAATAAASGIPSTPAPLDGNPLRPSTESTPTDRYGASAVATAPSAPSQPDATAATSPVEQSFAESWPQIQAMLDRGELTEAHKELSKWYSDPSLTPTDTERVDTLLSQLAGTVVYSTEHRLAPAYVVKEGETLESIAKVHDVPWQLLAKINGIAAADQVRPGQELKVLRGPFSAVVDLSRNQLTLMVDDRYAGKFPVAVTPGQSVNDGEWVVGKKSNEQAPGRALLLQGNPTAPSSPIPMLVIASESLTTSAADGTVIKIAAKDAEELSDILSIGSRVITRR